MKRLLLIIALVLLGVLALVEQSERWTYSLWRALDRVPEAEVLAHAGAPEPIAHAAGVVEGHVYTNSREALERALRDGYRFVELDLRKTIGGDYFAAHRYREFYEMTGGATFTFLPPTRKRVEESLLHGSLHPLFLEDACRILREKDAWLVTDKARDFGALLKACPMPERMIVEVSSLNQYFAALDAGIRYPALRSTPTASPKRRRRASRFSSSRPKPTPRPRSATPSSGRAEAFSSPRANAARNSKRFSDVRAPGSTRTGARPSASKNENGFLQNAATL